MTAFADATTSAPITAPARVQLDQPTDLRALLVFLAVLAGGLFFMAYSIYSDVAESGAAPTTILPFLLLGVAMV
ncbi:MAG: inorganic phosphate transporter, partial [Roseiarcus sp.]